MDSSASREMISIWNEQLATYAVKMIKKRMYFLEKLQNWAQIIHHGITNQQETLNIQYQCSVPLETNADESVLISDYMVKLEQLQEKEIRRGSTLIGPHRDDLLFYINEKEVHTFGSQGQQRTVALSLKLAEIELIAEIVGEYPILLLDDVLSELDQTRQTMLLDTFQNKVQTFITTTSIANVDLEKIKEAAIFDVSAGRIARRVE
jgi:DNA replication and repair protein RecF